MMKNPSVRVHLNQPHANQPPPPPPLPFFFLFFASFGVKGLMEKKLKAEIYFWSLYLEVYFQFDFYDLKPFNWVSVFVSRY
jgi:hypothetical protein